MHGERPLTFKVCFLLRCGENGAAMRLIATVFSMKSL